MDDVLCVDGSKHIAAHEPSAREHSKVVKPATAKEVDAIQEAYRRRQATWETALPLDAEQPALGSWIKGQRTDGSPGSFVLYCVACRAADMKADGGAGKQPKNLQQCWGRGKRIDKLAELRLCHAKKHADTPLHQRAVAELLQHDVFSTDIKSTRAPPMQSMMDVWAELHKGASMRCVAELQTYGGRTKVEAIQTCLSEACLAHDRKMLADATVLAIHQDVRQGMMQVRYSACLPDWTVQKGLLGLDLNPGTLSSEICETIKRIVQRLCTVDGQFDNNLFDSIASKVELLDADAAPDEQRSLRLLTTHVFPNVKAQVRDPAHCARRLATTPWSVDKFLADVHSFYIQSQDSITNVIQHSPDLRQMFGGNVEQVHCDLPLSEATLKRIRSLDYAAHRFESMCKPLCRFVLLLDSIWRTAADITVKRAGSVPAQRARMFLEGATAEGLLQLALLADASLQCMDVIRFYDSAPRLVCKLDVSCWLWESVR